MSDFFSFWKFLNTIRIVFYLVFIKMYQTLDDLEYTMLKQNRFTLRKFFSEVKVFLIIFVIVFCGSYLITNAQLLQDTYEDAMIKEEDKVNLIETLKVEMKEDNVKMREEKEKEIKNLILQYEGLVSQEKEPAEGMQNYLKSNLNTYHFEFNTLPPTNRIISDKINLNAPLVQSDLKDGKDEGKFDKDLENGVVKYPESANPWEKWTAFFFGHTSQEYWQKNPYGTVFRNIPKLTSWDVVQIVWEGTMYEYEVVETVIVNPSKVNENYLRYAQLDEEYVVLMGCYPIWRTDKRMMVFAKRIH